MSENRPPSTLVEVLAGLTLSQFVDKANSRHDTPELRQGRPTGVSEDITSLCNQIMRGEAGEPEDVGPIEAQDAAILASWLAFMRTPRLPMVNQLVGISATSANKARAVLEAARGYAKDVLESIVRENNGDADLYRILAREVFAADTQDRLAINGASQCHVYSRTSQFRCAILVQEEAAKKLSGRDMGIWHLRVLFR